MLKGSVRGEPRGGRGREGAIKHVGSDGGDLPLTQIRWQPTPSRTCLESLQPHQPLDTMQTARDAFRQQVAPNPPGP